MHHTAVSPGHRNNTASISHVFVNDETKEGKIRQTMHADLWATEAVDVIQLILYGWVELFQQLTSCQS